MLEHVNASTSSLPAGWLQPQWPTIAGVQALFTSRHGGVSVAPFDSLNLGDHVRDDLAHVRRNRERLAQVLVAQGGVVTAPVFLQQVHGCDVLALQPSMLQAHDACGAEGAHASTASPWVFDACVTDQVGVACTIMVADCLPVLLAHDTGVAVAGAHAGWRGLAGVQEHGVLESVWQSYAHHVRAHLGPRVRDADIAAHTQVWLGPCIGPQAFEVGDEVRSAFVTTQTAAASAFVPTGAAGKWRADLAALARLRLQRMGLEQVYGNDSSAPWCTFSNDSQFFSHRRDAAVLGSTGRMAACIWKV